MLHRQDMAAAETPGSDTRGADYEQPAGPVTNIPATTSRFVGRAADAERVRRLVRENRLVTLKGPPGAGKTRLAMEVARGLLEDFPDGVWMVELASKIDKDVVPGAIAEALGLREQASKPPTEALRGYLADKRLLILLDKL